MSNHQTISVGRSAAFDKPHERPRNKDGASLDGPAEMPGRSVSGRCKGSFTSKGERFTLERVSGSEPESVSRDSNARGSGSSLSMSHNSTAAVEGTQPDLPFHLTGSQAKTAYALRYNAEKMVAEAGIDCVGFLTLTIGNWHRGLGWERFVQVWDSNEASRRFNSLSTHLLKRVFEKAVVVTERHKSGAIHFHVLGVLRGRPDIRSGFQWNAQNSGASGELRRIWAMLRETLPAYGFGRAELTPIRKTGEAVACYVSKYVEKNLFNRLACDRRKKLVRYIGFEKRQLKPNEFSWASARATSWRIKTRQLAATVGIGAREQMAPIFGPRWAFKVSRVMNAVQDDKAPGFVWGWPEMQAARVLMMREGNLRKLVAENQRRSGGDSESKFLRAIGRDRTDKML